MQTALLISQNALDTHTHTRDQQLVDERVHLCVQMYTHEYTSVIVQDINGLWECPQIAYGAERERERAISVLADALGWSQMTWMKSVVFPLCVD